jgi:hypothetical protein
MKQVKLLSGLAVQKGEDGFWFVFENPNRKHALVNAEALGGMIAKEAVLQCLERLVAEHGVDIPPLAAPSCKECGKDL